jgi:hypothetical protein
MIPPLVLVYASVNYQSAFVTISPAVFQQIPSLGACPEKMEVKW